MLPQSPALPTKEKMTVAELVDFEAEKEEPELHRQRMLASERRIIRYGAFIDKSAEDGKVSVLSPE